MGWDGIRWDGMGRDGTGRDETRRYGRRWTWCGVCGVVYGAWCVDAGEPVTRSGDGTQVLGYVHGTWDEMSCAIAQCEGTGNMIGGAQDAAGQEGRRGDSAGRETEAHTSRSSSSWSFVLDDAARLPPESPPSPSLALSLVLRILPPLLFALALGCEWHTHRWKLSRSSSSAVSRLPTGMSNSLWLHCSAM